jgi:hypothetical protein
MGGVAPGTGVSVNFAVLALRTLLLVTLVDAMGWERGVASIGSTVSVWSWSTAGSYNGRDPLGLDQPLAMSFVILGSLPVLGNAECFGHCLLR